MMQPMAELYNPGAIAISDVPQYALKDFRDTIIRSVNDGARIAALFGRPIGNGADSIQLFVVLARADEGSFSVASTTVQESYPALTPACTQAHWFEREIAEQWGVKPEDHPWLKPIRFHRSYSQRDAWNRPTTSPIEPGVTDYFRVEGEEIHEVAVGPVHAGVIEPGHFRFQCHGEDVLSLEISLGYQHRGVERKLIGGPDKRTLHYMETLSGDTSIGHASAYCQVLEALTESTVSPRAMVIRGIALELERLANHTGDLGALAGDVGYLPTMSFCGRLRGDFLNMSATLCGNRFGRSLIRPGGTAFDIDVPRAKEIGDKMTAALKDVAAATELLWKTPSVMARFEETGTVTRETCELLGLVGVAARACGAQRDVRFEFPSGIYQFHQLPLTTWHTGDVFARAHVRRMEIQRSGQFIQEQLHELPKGELKQTIGELKPTALAISLIEGWRGEICHVALTDEKGKFAHYKVVDPSFHNWMGLAMALRDQQISDFPLCNKSFNLSYCGHDL
jgi:Ni,Fe-hydrogenase III large subunit